MTAPLETAPSTRDLERLYFELAQIGAPAVGARRPWRHRPATREDLIALAGEMLRYDARLLSILVQYMLEHWRDLHPTLLRRAMRGQRYPQALCVVLEFARSAAPDVEFRFFADYVCAGWPRVEPLEQFFVDAARPGGRIAARGLGRNLAPYARWGFLGTERATSDAWRKRTIGRYDRATRRRILQELLAEGRTFTLGEYLAAVDHAVSRQQALEDLRAEPGLGVTGHGRGARWGRAGTPPASPDSARRRPRRRRTGSSSTGAADR